MADGKFRLPVHRSSPASGMRTVQGFERKPRLSGSGIIVDDLYGDGVSDFHVTADVPVETMPVTFPSTVCPILYCIPAPIRHFTTYTLRVLYSHVRQKND